MRMHGVFVSGAACVGLVLTLFLNRPAQAQADEAWKRPEGPAPNWLTADADQWARRNTTRKALAKKVSFDFKGTSLFDIAKDISRQIGVPIQINHVELDNCGQSADVPITAQAKEIRLSEVREQILRPLDLNWRINESDIEITSNDDVSSEPMLMVYDLAYKSSEPVDLQHLSYLISRTIDPDEWMDYGGTGNSALLPFGSALVVVAPDDTHRKVSELISQLDKLPSVKPGEQWQMPLGLPFEQNPAIVKAGVRLRSGKISLPNGPAYTLVKLVPREEAKSEEASKPAEAPKVSKWSQPKAPVPAWLGPNVAADREAVLAKLRKPVSIDTNGTPLKDALAILLKAPGIDYWIDEVELDNVGTSADQPVTVSFHQASLSEVLQRMLKPLDLTYRVDGQRIEITSNDEANSSPTTRVYDMAYLSEKPFDLDLLCNVIAATVDPDEWQDYGGTGNSTINPAGSQLFISAPETTFVKLEALLYQLSLLHPDNLPSPKVDSKSNFIQVEVRELPPGSTIEIPTEGHYELRADIRSFGGMF